MEPPAIFGFPEGPASALKNPVLTCGSVESANSPELERVAVLAAHTDNSFIFTDVERRIQWVNSAFCRTTGYAFGEVVGKSPGALLQDPDTDQATVERMRRALNSERSFREEIFNYRKKRGALLGCGGDSPPAG